MQSIVWRGGNDTGAVSKENGSFLHLMDADKLSVCAGIEETYSHGRFSTLLLPQGFCLPPVMDSPQRPLHGCAGLCP